MEQCIRNSPSVLIVAVSLFAVLLCSAPARSQSSNKRCFSVEETFYKIHDEQVTKEIKPIKHCYSDKDHPYRYSVVDIPVSLAVGTVGSPEFVPPSHWYWILLQVEKPLPTEQMVCMMGVTSSPLDLKDCSSKDPLLRADWTVLSDGQVVYHGSSSGSGDGKFTKDYIFKFLGSFSTLPGMKYVVEVKFTKDGTPLNVANPHLIVVQQGLE